MKWIYFNRVVLDNVSQPEWISCGKRYYWQVHGECRSSQIEHVLHFIGWSGKNGR